MTGPAARVGDFTEHVPGVPIGTITGPGVTKVLIGNLPAAVAGDAHSCTAPLTSPHTPASSILLGSASVLINGQPAARKGDPVGCGGVISTGATSVLIGD